MNKERDCTRGYGEHIYPTARILTSRVINRSAVTTPRSKQSRTSPHKDKVNQRVPLYIVRFFFVATAVYRAAMCQLQPPIWPYSGRAIVSKRSHNSTRDMLTY